MQKKVIVKEYIQAVRTVEVTVDVEDEYDDGFAEAVPQLQDVGLNPYAVERAGMKLISDFSYVSDSSEYEPEEV